MEIQLWREILNPYDLAVKELTVKFEHLIQEHRQQGLYSPIEQVHGRVKTISSILDKCAEEENSDQWRISKRRSGGSGRYPHHLPVCGGYREGGGDHPRPEGYGKSTQERDYIRQHEKQRLPQLSYDYLLHCGYHERAQSACMMEVQIRTHGHEFLGHGGAFPPV